MNVSSNQDFNIGDYQPKARWIEKPDKRPRGSRPIRLNAVPGSPNLSKLNLDEQITYFEKRVNTWILEPAKTLLDTQNPDVDFAVLAILNPLPEMLAQYQGQSDKRVEERYRYGFKYIFGDQCNEADVTRIYADLRSAIAHTTFIGPSIMLHRESANLTTNYFVVGNRIVKEATIINVPEWYERTQNAIDRYVSELKDTDSSSTNELRRKFSERLSRVN